MLWIGGTQKEGESLVGAYLSLKDRLASWERTLADSDDDRARKVANQIGAYIDSDSGLKRFATLADIFRGYAGKWQ